jgi:Carbohydrate binding domain
MTKHISLVLASLALLFGGERPAAAGPILMNPGFEAGTLANWVASNGTPLLTTAEAHNGAYSVSALGSDQVRQNFAPVPTSVVTEVSFWAKVAGGPFHSVEFFYSDSTSDAFLVNGFTDDWTYFDVTAFLAFDKSLTGIAVYGTSQGPAYLDDFTVSVPDAHMPEPATLTVLGGVALAGAVGYRRRRASAASAPATSP